MEVCRRMDPPQRMSRNRGKTNEKYQKLKGYMDALQRNENGVIGERAKNGMQSR